MSIRSKNAEVSSACTGQDRATEAGFGREDLRSFNRMGEVGDRRRFAGGPLGEWVEQEAGEALSALGYT